MPGTPSAHLSPNGRPKALFLAASGVGVVTTSITARVFVILIYRYEHANTAKQSREPDFNITSGSDKWISTGWVGFSTLARKLPVSIYYADASTVWISLLRLCWRRFA